VAGGVDANAIDAGTWPPGYDLDRAENLVQRGLDELAMLTLP
ncbi:queuosine biosynthesis protein queC, partial [Mycolicibacter arupensis]